MRPTREDRVNALASALDGLMTDYLVLGSDKAFGWFASPLALEHLKRAGWALVQEAELDAYGAILESLPVDACDMDVHYWCKHDDDSD